MARVTRASKLKSPAKSPASPAPPAAKATPDTPVKSVEDSDAHKTSRQKRKSNRSHEYKRQKRKRAAEALKTLAKDPEQPLSTAERNKARAELYRQWRPKAQNSEKLSELEQIVLKQREELEQLRKQVGGASKTPDAADETATKTSHAVGRAGLRTRKTAA